MELKIAFYVLVILLVGAGSCDQCSGKPQVIELRRGEKIKITYWVGDQPSTPFPVRINRDFTQETSPAYPVYSKPEPVRVTVAPRLPETSPFFKMTLSSTTTKEIVETTTSNSKVPVDFNIKTELPTTSQTLPDEETNDVPENALVERDNSSLVEINGTTLTSDESATTDLVVDLEENAIVNVTDPATTEAPFLTSTGFPEKTQMKEEDNSELPVETTMTNVEETTTPTSVEEIQLSTTEIVLNGTEGTELPLERAAVSVDPDSELVTEALEIINATSMPDEAMMEENFTSATIEVETSTTIVENVTDAVDFTLPNSFEMVAHSLMKEVEAKPIETVKNESVETVEPKTNETVEVATTENNLLQDSTGVPEKESIHVLGPAEHEGEQEHLPTPSAAVEGQNSEENGESISYFKNPGVSEKNELEISSTTLSPEHLEKDNESEMKKSDLLRDNATEIKDDEVNATAEQSAEENHEVARAFESGVVEEVTTEAATVQTINVTESTINDTAVELELEKAIAEAKEMLNDVTESNTGAPVDVSSVTEAIIKKEEAWTVGAEKEMAHKFDEEDLKIQEDLDIRPTTGRDQLSFAVAPEDFIPEKHNVEVPILVPAENGPFEPNRNFYSFLPQGSASPAVEQGGQTPFMYQHIWDQVNRGLTANDERPPISSVFPQNTPLTSIYERYPLFRQPVERQNQYPVHIRVTRETQEQITPNSNETKCEWVFKSEPGVPLLLMFKNYSSLETPLCVNHHIAVEREGNGFESRWCGEAGENPGHVTFARNEIRLRLYTKGDAPYPTGFVAEIQALDINLLRRYTGFRQLIHGPS